jgi:AraC family transcriptional regulator, regulatory protein of adaptative response / methylated-DNA-[protein]-cysteine methyltransferase
METYPHLAEKATESTGLEAEIIDTLAAAIRQQVAEGREHLDVEQLMAKSHWSRRQTERRFRERYFTSPARYFRDCQWDSARAMLNAGDDVLSVSAKAGFASLGRLHDAVVARSGMTPGQLRRKGAGVQINYGFFETQVGIVLIAATKRGLCTLRLCGAKNDDDRLSDEVARFRADYEQADISEAPEAVQTYADQLVAFLDSRSADFCPTIDILQGTSFQREVWAELQNIAPGETVTYAELAARLGKPTATRAVANACACNELAIAIPCHRVIRSDGTLAGYRWGIAWKRNLLRLEEEYASRRQSAIPVFSQPELVGIS